ncbi:uncharacterized protein PAC_11395 [Phialocephala subalpina]|uniref:G protein-coupled receptor GPR1/2/3 C-terminal domain-containing protein n=1 Tax=Phialocephala subalpina TaxID=576137 RepID=A0A1L7X8Y3_9HELO|nr:uncharacterized protein PAC_11395 [Phialocephala subalpina]
MDVTNATFTSHDWTHFKYPLSLSPIPRSMKPGIIALCVFAFISCATTLSLLGLLTYRFITSRNDHRAPLYKNQYMLLIYSLVLADFQCDLGFFLDVVWLNKDQIIAPSVPCFVQAWLINIGDLSSGFFVFAIACHTFYNVVFGRRLGLTTLCWCIVGLWILAVILTCIPIILHPKNIFVTQGNWCSINGQYDSLRLYFHYIWVLAAEGIVLGMYLTTYIVLKRRLGTIAPQLTHQSANSALATATTNSPNSSRISRATTYMILYPVVYVFSTLPLAAGRISSMVGHTPAKSYLVAAGTIMACGGWMNCVLYSLTRSIFLSGKGDTNQEHGRSRYGYGSKHSALRVGDGIELVQGRKGERRYDELPSPVASTDNIVKTEEELKAGVTMKTTWDVRVEEVRGSQATIRKGDLGHRTFIA